MWIKTNPSLNPDVAELRAQSLRRPWSKLPTEQSSIPRGCGTRTMRGPLEIERVSFDRSEATVAP